MRRLAWLLVGMIALIVGVARPAFAESSAEMLARMPAGEAVYGLAFGPDGQLYASDADGLRAGMVFIYTSSGDLVDRVTVPAGPTGVIALRGLAFDSRGNLYLADVANGQAGRGRIVKYTTRGRFSVLASGLTAPTGLAFDRSDVLYVTDGVNGAVLSRGNLLVAASRADEIEIFSSDGRLLDRISPNSSSILSRPTSLVASGRSVYVASLSPEGGGSHLSRFALSDLSDD